MSLIRVMEKAGFVKDLRESLREDSVNLASPHQLFEALDDDQKVAELKKSIDEKALVVTGSWLELETTDYGIIVHSNRLGVFPVRDVKIPYTNRSPIKMMPELSGVTLDEALHNMEWNMYFTALLNSPFPTSDAVCIDRKGKLSKLADPEKIIIATPNLKSRRPKLKTLVTISKVDIKNENYLVIGSIYDPNTTIAYPLVEVPN